MAQPDWLDRELYPFASHFLDLPAGRMHYVDEGSGEPVVMLHGNPTWSFLYRHLVVGLSSRWRCVAPDHLGFGLSDKPARWSYRPQDHAENFQSLVNALELGHITLVVQDWGGPIGLSYAVRHPERVRAVVVMNSWLWSLAGDWRFEWFSWFMGGPIGRFLIRRFHFLVRPAMKLAFADRTKLTPAIRRHYLLPQRRGADRKAVWVFAEQLIASSRWLDGLWSQRGRLAGIPALLAWGMRDPAFREAQLRRWQLVFPRATTVELPDVGHFVQEELGPDLVPLVEDFLSSLGQPGDA